MKWKILIGILLIFLVIGTACAVNVSDLKVPIGYNEETEGYYYLNTDEDTHLYIGKLSDNEGVFETTSDYFVVSIGDNFYTFEDILVNSYGVQEKVNIDGEDYLVSIDKTTPLSDTDRTMFIEDLKDFNSKNNLQPIEVEI